MFCHFSIYSWFSCIVYHYLIVVLFWGEVVCVPVSLNSWHSPIMFILGNEWILTSFISMQMKEWMELQWVGDFRTPQISSYTPLQYPVLLSLFFTHSYLPSLFICRFIWTLHLHPTRPSLGSLQSPPHWISEHPPMKFGYFEEFRCGLMLIFVLELWIPFLVSLLPLYFLNVH